MQTLNLSKDFIKRDFKNFLKDINAAKNKYTKESYINTFVDNLVVFHGVYDNKYLKTKDFDQIRKEILEILEE